MKSNRNKAHLGLGALLLAGAFLSWLVLLGGVASVQKVGKALCCNAQMSRHRVDRLLAIVRCNLPVDCQLSVQSAVALPDFYTVTLQQVTTALAGTA